MEAELPVACTLSPPEARERERTVLAALRRHVQRIVPRADGYTLELATTDEAIAAAAAVVQVERQCCAFLTFGLTVEPGERGVTLALTGPPGTRDLLAQWLERNPGGSGTAPATSSAETQPGARTSPECDVACGAVAGSTIGGAGAASTLTVDVPEWVWSIAAPGEVRRTDDEKMALAIRLAAENVERGTGGPFGAAVFELESGRLVAAGVNSVLRREASPLHAEMVAIMLAHRHLGSFTLGAPGMPAHELVTSGEPCAMCLGATLWSGVTRLVIGARRDEIMAAGFDEGPVFPASYDYLADRGITIVRDVGRADAVAVLDAYARRGGPVYNPGNRPSA